MSLERVKHIVLVLSGKGGVGKSSVATQLALSLSLAGRSVGVLDMDLTGPSVPRMFGVEKATITQTDSGWRPVTVHDADTASGRGSLHVISLGFMLAQRGDPVVWRGPKKTAMVRQFLSDVVWGDLDVLVIDTPPGTSDEHITLAESLRPFVAPAAAADADDGRAQPQGPRLAGAVVVTTPQAVATADVRKELNFCKNTGIPVLGVVENMSGFVCENCSECTYVFSKGGGETMARKFGLRLLATVPIDPQFGDLIETGRRPLYPEGTMIEGQPVPADAIRPPAGSATRSSGGAERGDDDALLVEKYKSCSLAIIFRRMAQNLLVPQPTPVAAD